MGGHNYAEYHFGSGAQPRGWAIHRYKASSQTNTRPRFSQKWGGGGGGGGLGTHPDFVLEESEEEFCSGRAQAQF